MGACTTTYHTGTEYIFLLLWFAVVTLAADTDETGDAIRPWDSTEAWLRAKCRKIAAATVRSRNRGRRNDYVVQPRNSRWNFWHHGSET